MNEKINDGGPAFPMRLEDQGNGCGGMSLRDYFAARSMQGHRANPDDNCELPEKVAERAYSDADAMLKAREVKP